MLRRFTNVVTEGILSGFTFAIGWVLGLVFLSSLLVA